MAQVVSHCYFKKELVHFFLAVSGKFEEHERSARIARGIIRYKYAIMDQFFNRMNSLVRLTVRNFKGEYNTNLKIFFFMMRTES